MIFIVTLPTTIVIASRNPGKLAELKAFVSAWGVADVRGVGELTGAEEPEESGSTYAENARIKAESAAAATGLPALADDSGLEVDALGGTPGVHSARYGGPGLTDAERVAKLLAELEGVPESERTARFRAVALLAWPDGRIVEATGVVEGRIAEAPRGSQGFGYDPVFYYPEWNMTFGQAGVTRKSTVDHRSRAMHALYEVLIAEAQGAPS